MLPDLLNKIIIMDRRESLKLIAWSTVSTSLIANACQTKEGKVEKDKTKDVAASNLDRTEEEKALYEKLISQKIFYRPGNGNYCRSR